MSNETEEKSLRDLIKGKKFRIPMYQRNYKWNTKMAEKLVSNIVSCYGKEGGETKSLGLITLYKAEDGIYDVIDGQQRLTTLAILLNLLESETNIDLTFERDYLKSETDKYEEINKRSESVKGKDICECTDIERIKRNRKAMNGVLPSGEKVEDKKKLAEFVLNKVVMLCSTLDSAVNDLAVDEFMNLNAYKTAFSISDHIRANLISLNSFHRKTMETNKYGSILARCLSKNSYKTAVAILYNNIQKKLYECEEKNSHNNDYKSIYELLKSSEKIIDPEEQELCIESRINILFGGVLLKQNAKQNAEKYASGEITEDLDYWIKMLQKLAYVNKLLDELESELKQGEFHSFKQIDDYQKMTCKSFIREVFDGISRLDEEWDSQTLAKVLQKYSNIDSVLIKSLNQGSKKLANLYLEAFAYSTDNQETNKKADREENKDYKLPRMTMNEVVEEISGCGRYIIDRYEREHREDLDITITIPPVINLEDRENIDFGGELEELANGDEMTIGQLFQYDIKIPVIQRDYCMGARMTGNNDFLAFLLTGYKENKELSASTILVSVSGENPDNKTLYIFDGQQRTFTLYKILKYCGESELKKYSFVGRGENQYGSPYSEKAVKHLEKVIDVILRKEEVNKSEFANYIKEKVVLKVKTVEKVSGAEQFFMDINGGVALEKYEIYKAMLCEKLGELEEGNVVKKIENEWLDFFYKYRKEYLSVKDIKKDESGEEELLEIRFIEYVCRFVYRKNHKETKHLPSFDEIESKGELVAKLKYINNLDENDIKGIVTIMDHVAGFGINDFCKDELIDVTPTDPIEISSKSDKVILIYKIMLKKEYKIINKKNESKYLMRFIWSLSDENRKYIKKYYKYREISSLIKIYDDDQIMRDILLALIDDNEVKGDKYIYYNEFSSHTVKIYGGYKNSCYKTDYHLINDKQICEKITYGEIISNEIISGKILPDKIIFDNIPVNEVPVYYWSNITDIRKTNNGKDSIIMRICYLRDMGDKYNSSELNFALVSADPAGIKYEDGTNSNFIPIKQRIQYIKCRNWDGKRRYCYFYRFFGECKWRELYSAYLFKADALEAYKYKPLSE
jgi:hypothetical protein